jgi:hypothetical protein
MVLRLKCNCRHGAHLTKDLILTKVANEVPEQEQNRWSRKNLSLGYVVEIIEWIKLEDLKTEANEDTEL